MGCRNLRRGVDVGECRIYMYFHKEMVYILNLHDLLKQNYI